MIAIESTFLYCAMIDLKETSKKVKPIAVGNKPNLHILKYFRLAFLEISAKVILIINKWALFFMICF